MSVAVPIAAACVVLCLHPLRHSGVLLSLLLGLLTVLLFKQPAAASKLSLLQPVVLQQHQQQVLAKALPQPSQQQQLRLEGVADTCRLHGPDQHSQSTQQQQQQQQPGRVSPQHMQEQPAEVQQLPQEQHQGATRSTAQHTSTPGSLQGLGAGPASAAAAAGASALAQLQLAVAACSSSSTAATGLGRLTAQKLPQHFTTTGHGQHQGRNCADQVATSSSSATHSGSSDRDAERCSFDRDLGRQQDLQWHPQGGMQDRCVDAIWDRCSGCSGCMYYIAPGPAAVRT